MNKTVKNHGGVLVRVLTTLNGFYAKNGSWPSTLQIQANSLAALALHHLTPLGFFLMQSKLDIVEGPEGDIIAADEDENTFSYSEEIDRAIDAPEIAHQWLGLDLDLDA